MPSTQKDVLERTQRNLELDATEWVKWFLGRLSAALDSADGVLRAVRAKSAFWEHHARANLNERQTKVVNLLLEGDFKGKLQTSKYAKLAKCSAPTAFRDLDELVDKGVLRSEGVGRATSYALMDEYLN